MTSKYLNLLISFVLFGIVALTIHEWAHYHVAALFGIKGVVMYSSIVGGTFIPDISTPINTWVVYTAGGIVTALFLFVIWFFATHVGQPWDPDDACAVFTIMMYQFCYGMAETSLFYSQSMFNVLAPISMVVGFLVGVIYYFPKLIVWWSKEE